MLPINQDNGKNSFQFIYYDDQQITIHRKNYEYVKRDRDTELKETQKNQFPKFSHLDEDEKKKKTKLK